MAKLELISVSVILCVYLTAFVQCQATPDLGPSEPTFETCETFDCPKNSKCVDDHGYVYCECNTGKTGVNCTQDDPCMERKTNCPAGSVCFGDCDPNVICEGATGFAHCRGCVAGWTGMACEQDVDECAGDPYPCLHESICKNTVGDFECACKAGWTRKICDCKKGTACDLEESKVDEAKDGSIQQAFNTVVLFASVLTYYVI